MNSYQRAIQLLHTVSTDKGFLASANDISNYRRIWARDGVICGLAGLLDGDEKLVSACKATLQTLADHQHYLGNIPSNVFYDEPKTLLSFGGLAGRVDTISWFVIGMCNYAHITGDIDFAKAHLEHINRGLKLMEAWEFNHNHLMYVPRSGNWADEYITEGYILYDQLLRLWALRCFDRLFPNEVVNRKANRIQQKIVENYRKHKIKNDPYHPKAFNRLRKKNYWVASFNPSGYQKQYDAFANALALFLNIDSEGFENDLIMYSEELRNSLPLKLLPAFWPPIKEGDMEWSMLENNRKYEFRNIPYEFHNGGTWQMVNGFYGLGLVVQKRIKEAKDVLIKIDFLNQKEDWGFYENFNSETSNPTGVPNCAWSAAGSVILNKVIQGKKLLS